MDNRSFKEKMLQALPILEILGGLAAFIKIIFKKDVEQQQYEKGLEKYFKKHPETLKDAIEAVQNEEEG